MSLARLLMLQMCYGPVIKLLRSALQEAAGGSADAVYELDLKRPADAEDVPHVPSKAVREALLALASDAAEKLVSTGGSNAYAVAGKWTDSGNAQLAGDPHLGLANPCLFYLVHLKSEDGAMHVRGASVGGIPFTVIGNNDSVCWSVTLSIADQDTTWLVPTKNTGAGVEQHLDQIAVKGRSTPVMMRTRVSEQYGPLVDFSLLREEIVPKSMLDGEADYYVGIQAAALMPWGHDEANRRRHPLFTFADLSFAKTVGDVQQAVSQLRSPTLNFNFATSDGHVGYQMAGDVPLRRGGKPSYFAVVATPGEENPFDHVGVIPAEELPVSIDPEDGFIVSANHKTCSDEHPHSVALGDLYKRAFRANRIRELLTKKRAAGAKIDMDFMACVQLDVVSHAAREFCGAKWLATYKAKSARHEALLERLRQWRSFSLDTESTTASVFVYLVFRLHSNLLGFTLGGVGMDPLLKAVNNYVTNGSAMVNHVLSLGDESTWVSKAGGMEALMELSLRETDEGLTAHFRTTNSNSWRYGAIHQANIHHPLGQSAPGLFGSLALTAEQPGGDSTVRMSAMVYGEAKNDPLGAKLSAVMRAVHDTGDWSKSMWCINSGQSGDVSSVNYDDLFKVWAAGDMVTLAWTDADIEESTVRTVSLRK